MQNLLLRKLGMEFKRCRKCLLPITQSSMGSIMVNSIPKSGTHLLFQLFEDHLGLRDYGEFIASTPSFRMVELGNERLMKRLNLTQPSELLRGHLFFSASFADVFVAKDITQFFIFRDPRDIVCSEAHYLANMNRWHRMHRRFSALSSPHQQILLAIRGIDSGNGSPYYPDINVRCRRYIDWIGHPSTCSVRFEDLAGLKSESEVRRIMRFYGDAVGWSGDVLESKVSLGLERLVPQNSHTFREGGGVRSWERRFDERLKDEFKAIAGDLLIDLGYERDLDW